MKKLFSLGLLLMLLVLSACTDGESEEGLRDSGNAELDDALALFLDNHVETYLEDGVSYQVLLGLYHLGLVDDFEIVLSAADHLDGEGQLFQAIIKHEIMGEDTASLKSQLLVEAELEWLYTTSLTYIGLDGVSGDISTFEAAYLEMVEATEITATDHDTLGIVYLALNHHNQDVPARSEILDFLKANPYGNLWGNNASTFAQLLMVFTEAEVALDQSGMVQDGKTILEHILSHQSEDGAFYYLTDDEEPDMAFSTPQAFLALAYYHAYLIDGTTGLYDID